MKYRRRHFLELRKKNQPYTYGDLLNTYEWLNIRERILKLDGGRCKKCKKYGTKKRNQEYFEDWLFAVNKPRSLGNKVDGPTYLEVHHGYYIHGYLPWQYEDDCYLTLCSDCHRDLHVEEKFLVYADRDRKTPLNMTPCSRCKGVGWFDCYQHIENGMCFKCHGFQYDELVEFYKQNGSF